MVQQLEVEQEKVKRKMEASLSNPVFADYDRVLRSFELDLKVRCLIIALTFPIERFFDNDGMRRARSRFKQRLGLGKVEESRGDTKKQKAGGSGLARKFLNWFIHYRVDTEKRRSHTLQMDELQAYYDQLARKWNDNPDAYAARERSKAKLLAKRAVDSELRGLVS